MTADELIREIFTQEFRDQLLRILTTKWPHHDAEDALQVAFNKFYQAIVNGNWEPQNPDDPAGSARSWLLQSAHWTNCNRHRKTKRESNPEPLDSRQDAAIGNGGRDYVLIKEAFEILERQLAKKSHRQGFHDLFLERQTPNQYSDSQIKAIRKILKKILPELFDKVEVYVRKERDQR